MEDYIDKFHVDRQALEAAVRQDEPNMGSVRAPRAVKTSAKIFDRLSKNVLQNVMSFFNYKGSDFMKMRSINQKTKNSYM